MTTECCGKQQSTRFCPNCGKRLLQEDALATLLEHLRQRQRSEESRTAHAAETDNGSVRSGKWLQRRSTIAAKWAKWADALESLLSKQIDGKGQQ